MKLYIYDHCPFCVKARMIFGYKNLDCEMKIIQNDDEKTPIEMIGVKMVPILEKNDGSYMPESMDIVHYIDQNFGEKILISQNRNQRLNEFLEEIGEILYNMAMPRWVKMNLAEFETQSAIDYFVNKKQQKLGDFNEIMAKSEEYIIETNKILEKYQDLPHSENSVNENLSDDDIDFFAALRSLSAVKNIQYPPKILAYMQNTAKLTKIPLHLDIAI